MNWHSLWAIRSQVQRLEASIVFPPKEIVFLPSWIATALPASWGMVLTSDRADDRGGTGLQLPLSTSDGLSSGCTMEVCSSYRL